MKKKIFEVLAVRYSWKSLFEASFFCAYLYAFLEWLFIVTKPSFLSAVSLVQKLRIFLFTASFLTGIALLALTGLFALSCVLRGKKIQVLLRNLGTFIPAVTLGSMSLLLFDNFTYTVFSSGLSPLTV